MIGRILTHSERLAGTIRAGVGGVLMGLANLVPGISGGTMLLAAGIYTDFVEAVADITTLKFRRSAIVLVATVVGAAGVAILLLAGAVAALVRDHRWVMYSLFIGLTLGGAPLVWRLAKPVTGPVYAGAVGGFVVMLLMVAGLDAPSGAEGGNYLFLTLAGVVGASAMILPGISGGYLLLLLGQYETVLGAVDQIRDGLLGDSSAGIARDMALVLEGLKVAVPVGIGVVAGVVGVSNLLRWLLRRYDKPTLGALLGLLLGAVVGLWPFQRGLEPAVGDLLNGIALTAADIADLAPADWPVEFFDPALGQIAGALALIGVGLFMTVLIDHIGGKGSGVGENVT
ncbi:MAG: DUF368 domain-containing protein [Gemmatimonadetes bacterium]|nr:DUF368 domain-containing protein [Gemmatimonadota bacterium]